VVEGRTRPAWAEVDLASVRHNAGVLSRLVAPAALWAVVKADGYGHGAVAVARAAVEGGASGLAVALVDEGIELREAGVRGPVLLLSEAPADALGSVVESGLTPTVASDEGLRLLSAAARRAGVRVPVHVKVDTGMHRVGAPPDEVAALAAGVVADPMLDLEGLWTHLAVADGVSEDDRQFTEMQLRRFDEALAAARAAGAVPALTHAANSAAAIAWSAARRDLVRCGIALYGALPSRKTAGSPETTLRPVLSLHARVTAVRRLDAGERPSYGRLRPLPERSLVATVPLGYADGVRRALFGAGCTVLVRGRRRPLAGMVTMDQIVVDCGDGPVAPGDHVTLLGRQGDQEITASEWADLIGTISYEVLCGIGERVPRVLIDRPEP